MGDEGLSGGAVPGHDVDQSRWETSGGACLGQQQRGGRRQLGGLHDDGVPAGEGYCDPRDEHDRRSVPRQDDANDAQRLLDRVGQVARRSWDLLARELVGHAGPVARELRRFRGVVAGVADHLAHVAHVGERYLLGAREERLAPSPDKFGPAAATHRCPNPLRLGRRGHGGLDLIRAAERDPRNGLAGRRIDRVEQRGTGGRLTFPGDERAVRRLGELIHGSPCAGSRAGSLT